MFATKMKTLTYFLKDVPDFRRPQGRRIQLNHFLEAMILAGMSGHFGIRSIARFVLDNEDFFISRYQLLHGVPKQTNIHLILKSLDYERLNEALRKWASQYLDPKDEHWIAIDGKAIGSTVTEKHGSKQNYKSMVSMFCSKMGVVISSKAIENKKSNEGDAARMLIDQLELKGMVFTMDALHCQKKQRRLSWSQEMTMSFK